MKQALGLGLLLSGLFVALPTATILNDGFSETQQYLALIVTALVCSAGLGALQSEVRREREVFA